MDIRDKMLPVLKPYGDQKDIDAIGDVIKSGWWGKGPKVAEFEKKFAKMVGAKYSIAVTSNSAGLDLVLRGLKVEGEVINPTMSFITTAMVPLWSNLKSVIVDVDPVNLNISPEEVKKHMNPWTGAVIAVNMNGVPAPIDEIRKFYKGLIIEDCAHSCYVDGAGTKGDVAIWSFQAVKTMPCGDGGMITTNDKEIYDKLKNLTWFGVSSTYDRTKITGKPGYTWDYSVSEVGYKCYMIDLTAALCLSQMEKLPDMLRTRQYIRDRYIMELGHLLDPPALSETVQYYSARVPSNMMKVFDGIAAREVTRDDLIDYLASKNIHTSVHFKPLHLFEVFEETNYWVLQYESIPTFPVAESVWKSLISLPCHAGMTETDIDYVIYWVKEFFKDVSIDKSVETSLGVDTEA